MSECRRGCGARVAATLVALAFGLFGPTAQSLDFAVDSALDSVDAAPGDGVCADRAGRCTLRAAIQEANRLAGDDAITLPAGVFALTLSGTGEDLAATGDLDITANLAIRGVDARQTIIDGGARDRVFDIDPNGASPIVTISALTVRNGSANGANGGGIRVHRGIVTLDDCRLSGNHAGTDGGAIANAGRLVVARCTLSGNSAAGHGGGLYNGASVALTNATLSGNRAAASGGGLYNAATAALLQTTIALNAAGSGGGLANTGIATLKSTLLDANTGGNCRGTITSDGTNLDSGASCAFAAAGDFSNTDPRLAALADNGGPAPTHALLSGSPAIDAAANSGCPTEDQRGVTRPVAGDAAAACDIGALEATSPADLAISKRHQTDCLTLHDHIVYALTVTNLGPGPADSVTITDPLPVGVALVSTTPPCARSGTTLTCTLGSLSAGASAAVTVDATAEQVAAITNTASVRAAQSDPDLSNNSSSVTTLIDCSGNASGCFIVATFGSTTAAPVQELRGFRDRFLAHSRFGQWLIRTYSRYSPAIARVLREHAELRALVRAGLTPVIGMARVANGIPEEWSGSTSARSP